MSNCYKCGKSLPGAEVECEAGCATSREPAAVVGNLSPSVMKYLEQEMLDAMAEADLAGELALGKAAAMELAMHLKEMGAQSARQQIEFQGETYLVFIKKI